MRLQPMAESLLLGMLALAVCAGGALAQQYDVRAAYPAGSLPPAEVRSAFSGPGQTVGAYDNGLPGQNGLPSGGGTAETQAATGAMQYDSAAAYRDRVYVERLPPVDGSLPQRVEPAAKYGQNYPGGLVLPEDDAIEQQESERKGLPPGMRRAGCFQGITMDGAWLAAGTGRDRLGLSTASASGEFILPSLIPQSFFLIAPVFGVYRFEDSGRYDIPDDVYDAAIGFGLKGRANERLSYQFKVAVGAYSDFDNDSSEAVRVRGYGLGSWKWNPTVDLTFGVAYVDLENWPVVPIGGLTIRPDEERVLELTFPRMAYSRRLATTGMLGRPTEYWGTLALEMGGGRWVVKRSDETTGDLTYSDWRLTLGLQQKTLDAYDLKFDVGYVFGRRLEYEDDRESFAPDDTFILTLTGRF